MYLVKVYYTHLDNIDLYKCESIIKELGVSDKTKLYTLKGIHKKQFLVGRYLLKIAITDFRSDLSLNDIRYNHNSKPVFDTDLSFSISHSHHCVCCALTNNYSLKLGIDTQYVNRIMRNTSNIFFSDRELELIEGDKRLVYHFWTTKESILKACSDNVFKMNEIDCSSKKIFYRNESWTIHNLDISLENITKIAINNQSHIETFFVHEKDFY